MPDTPIDRRSMLKRAAGSIRIVPLILAAIGAVLLAYGAVFSAQTPQTLGAALIGVGIVAQISAMMRQGQR